MKTSGGTERDTNGVAEYVIYPFEQGGNCEMSHPSPVEVKS
jgi:hypothetical protein